MNHDDILKLDPETRGKLMSMSSNDREQYLADLAHEKRILEAHAAVEKLEALDAAPEEPKRRFTIRKKA